MYRSDSEIARHYWATYVESWTTPRMAADAAFDVTFDGLIIRIVPRSSGFAPGGLVVRPAPDTYRATAAIHDYVARWPDPDYIPEITLPPWETESGAWQHAFVTAGWTPGGWRPLIMGRVLDDVPQMRVPGVRFGLVQTANDMRQVRRIAEDSFAAQPQFQRFFLPEGLAGRISVYGAWADGAVVATAAGYFLAGGCGIYSVATAPRYRRRGIASALLARIMADAKAVGLPVATLSCTPDRVALYARSGFRLVGQAVEMIHSE